MPGVGVAIADRLAVLRVTLAVQAQRSPKMKNHPERATNPGASTLVELCRDVDEILAR